MAKSIAANLFGKLQSEESREIVTASQMIFTKCRPYGIAALMETPPALSQKHDIAMEAVK